MPTPPPPLKKFTPENHFFFQIETIILIFFLLFWPIIKFIFDNFLETLSILRTSISRVVLVKLYFWDQFWRFSFGDSFVYLKIKYLWFANFHNMLLIFFLTLMILFCTFSLDHFSFFLFFLVVLRQAMLCSPALVILYPLFAERCVARVAFWQDIFFLLYFILFYFILFYFNATHFWILSASTYASLRPLQKCVGVFANIASFLFSREKEIVKN